MSIIKPRARDGRTKRFKRFGISDTKPHVTDYNYWSPHPNSILSKAIQAKSKGNKKDHDAYREWKYQHDQYVKSMDDWGKNGYR